MILPLPSRVLSNFFALKRALLFWRGSIAGLRIDVGGSTGTVDVDRLGGGLGGGTVEDANDNVVEAGRVPGPGAVLGRREIEVGAISKDEDEREMLGRREVVESV